jgi:hypothetical protein
MTGPIVIAPLTPNVRFLVLAASLIKEESRKGPRVVQLEGEYWASQMLQTARNDVRRMLYDPWIVGVIRGRT